MTESTTLGERHILAAVDGRPSDVGTIRQRLPGRADLRLLSRVLNDLYRRGFVQREQVPGSGTYRYSIYPHAI